MKFILEGVRAEKDHESDEKDKVFVTIRYTGEDWRLITINRNMHRWVDFSFFPKIHRRGSYRRDSVNFTVSNKHFFIHAFKQYKLYILANTKENIKL